MSHVALLYKPLFSPGRCVMTRGIEELAETGQLDITHYLNRHLSGDWGDLDSHDKNRNNAALKSGAERLFSAYQVSPDLKIWIITECDRSVTTILLPDEY